ncbi:hypothetical protein AAFG07_33115 [Bradyrhizobium sp. B097]|uniref:hypothetical protein n=1 Tax=Bradyrhizobium sp. B097 TaxID=3140244 RepID=UPI00318339FE
MAKGTVRSADRDWWTLWPEIFGNELAASARLGFRPRTVHKQNGVLILEANWPVQGQAETMRLRIGYSPLHPFFRPAVAVPNERFDSPPPSVASCAYLPTIRAMGLESTGRRLHSGAADLLLRALEARKEGRWDDAAKLEEQAADPLMPYFAGACEEDSVILFDGQVTLPPAQHGLLEVVCSSRSSRTNTAAFEGVLRQLKTSSGTACE